MCSNKEDRIQEALKWRSPVIYKHNDVENRRTGSCHQNPLKDVRKPTKGENQSEKHQLNYHLFQFSSFFVTPNALTGGTKRTGEGRRRGKERRTRTRTRAR
jgi:hypothetical protein